MCKLQERSEEIDRKEDILRQKHIRLAKDANALLKRKKMEDALAPPPYWKNLALDRMWEVDPIGRTCTKKHTCTPRDKP